MLYNSSSGKEEVICSLWRDHNVHHNEHMQTLLLEAAIEVETLVSKKITDAQ